MTSMNIIFRTDASLNIGTGHVMRCLTLAQAFRYKGARCHFICREHAGNLLELIRQHGFKAHALPMQVILQEKLVQQDEINGNILPHAAWLGADWQTDASQTKYAIGDLDVNWLIVDHYALDSRWETELKFHYKKLMVIDDLADRPHACDLLLDQNYYVDMDVRYEKLAPQHCKSLLGPKYALLRPEFKEIRSNLKIHNRKLERLFVFFGGNDPSNETSKALHAIKLLDFDNISIDVVVGRMNPHYEEISSLCRKMPDAKIHRQVSNIAELMRNADLAIGAAGSTTWERCCIGLPSLVWCIAENQLAIAKSADEIGVCINLGKASNVSVQIASNALGELIKNKKKRQKMTKNSLGIVDGEGVTSVLNEINHKRFILKISTDE